MGGEGGCGVWTVWVWVWVWVGSKLPFYICFHYCDVIMVVMASQITSLTSVYSTVYSGADQRKHESSASLAFVRGIHRWTMNSPHTRPVTGKMFLFDDVIMPIHQSFQDHPASIATLAQRRHWSASSRSAADVAPTLVFRRLRCYSLLAFCRSATVGVS